MTQTVKLRDGSRVRLRPVTPEDRELILDGVRRMSPESRYRRFFTVVNHLSSSTLDYLSNVDHVDHEAIVAIDPGTGLGLGVARYVRRTAEPDTAEVAFAVVDDWQGRGLGRALLTSLTARARQEGITRFYAFVQAENQHSLGMLRGISPPRTESHGSELEVAVDLPAERGMGTQLGALLRGAAEGLIEAGQLMRVSPRAAHAEPAVVAWGSISTIVVGAGGSETAAVVAQGALDIAKRFGATLHAVAAYRAPVDRPHALQIVGAVREAAQQQAIETVGHAILGDPSSALIDVCGETAAELLVVGSRGMTGAAGLLGSVPNTVSHHAPCSVLIVRTT